MQATKRPERFRAAEPFIVALAAAVFVLGVYLRFANLSDNPGWDGDEGYNWSIASNLASGQVRMYALRYAFVQHPPLFYLVGAAVMRVWTHDLIALRAVTASCGVLTMVVLFAIARRLGGLAPAVAALTFYALWPQAVLQVRWAYTYNLLALLVMLALWATLPIALPSEDAPRDAAMPGSRQVRSPRPRAALLAGVVTGLALATDQEAIAMIPAVGLLLWPGGPRALLLAGISATIAPAAYIGWMLATRRTDFLFDIHHTASRLDAGPGELLLRFSHLVTFDPLIALGILGLLFVPAAAVRVPSIVLVATFAVLILEVRDPSPYFRAAEPLLPLCALGIGMMVRALLVLLARLRPNHPASGNDRGAGARSVIFKHVAAMILLVPFAVSMAVADVTSVRGRFTTGISSLLPRSALDAREMTSWVNARVGPKDLVLVMPSTSWLFRCRTADFLQAVAISGQATAFYPAGLSRGRFLYDTRPAAARYAVVDDFTRLWVRENVPERLIVDKVIADWPRVYRLGEYAVYQNPGPRDR